MLRGGRSFAVDPLTAVVGALCEVGEGELAVLQVLASPVREPWGDHALRALLSKDGTPIFPASPELLTSAREKISKPLFAVRLRLAVRAGSEGRRLELLRLLLGTLAQYSSPGGNELIALDSEDWSPVDQERDLLRRTAHRSGMILSVEELAAIVHLPGKEVSHPAFLRQTHRTKRAPESLNSGVFLGRNEHQGQLVEVRLSDTARLQHTYIIGGSGTGKSTLLLSLILQDLEAGHGLAVLDPHGDVIDEVLARLPEDRIGDVVLLDPADEDFPVGFNILSAHSDIERTLLSSDLVSVFRRLATSWGDQMTAVLGNAILAMLEHQEPASLLELRRFLVDRDFRTRFLAGVSDSEVAYFWQKEFPLLRGNPQAPILTRLDAFLRPRLIRNMVGQAGRSLDFRAILDQRKVLLCKLAQGAIGEENAHLLGSLIVGKIQQVALSRQDTAEAGRSPFFVFIDEFHNFVTPSLSALLSGVRKYGVGLTLAHQNLSQLSTRSPELVDSLLANAGSRICFRLGDQDARRLAQGFSFFDASDLQSLGTGEAIASVGGTGSDFNLATVPIPRIDPGQGQPLAAAALKSSREQFATPRADLTPPPSAGVREASPPSLPAVESQSIPAPLVAREVKVVSSPGRGGQQHKYLQGLIQKFAEERGFQAAVEQTILAGHGAVDVALSRGDERIAVEITITTPTDHEVANIHKCLAAGFSMVLVVASDNKALGKVRAAAERELSKDDYGRLQFLTPNELPEYLDSLPIPETTQTVGGYRVKVKHQVGAESVSQMEAVRQTIARSLRKLGAK
jgi:hypothetical protein